MLLAATTRPGAVGRSPRVGGARRAASTLELEPLARDDSERMVRELLGGELQVLERDLIIDRADGNPFFVEELLATSDRPGCREARRRDLAGRRSSCHRRRSGLDPDRPRGADGSPGSGRKGCSASGLRYRAGVLDRTRVRAPWRCRARLSCARRTRLRTQEVRLVDGRRAGIRHQARTDPRGRLRRAFRRPGVPGSTPGSRSGWRESPGDETNTRLYSRITSQRQLTRRSPTSPGRARGKRWKLRPRAIRWLAARPNWR